MTTRVVQSFSLTLSEPKPPSVNHMYTTGFRGKRVLSKAGIAFKSALTSAVAEACMTLPWREAIDAVYTQCAWVKLDIEIHQPIYNKSWKAGGRTEKGDPQSPYKKMDGTNLIKAIEDAIAAGTGIDDAAHLSVHMTKVHDATSFITIAYHVLAKE